MGTKKKKKSDNLIIGKWKYVDIWSPIADNFFCLFQ